MHEVGELEEVLYVSEGNQLLAVLPRVALSRYVPCVP